MFAPRLPGKDTESFSAEEAIGRLAAATSPLKGVPLCRAAKEFSHIAPIQALQVELCSRSAVRMRLPSSCDR
jgi:hypothetical protein